jgi:FAD dependent oxidoreductase TIGR03364
MQTTHFDILVIGGGALGAFHAYHALQRGLSVALFEKDPAPNSATVRNFGQIVPSGMNPTWQAHGRKSLEVYSSIQAKWDLGIQQNGSIYIASDDEERQLLEELHQINRDNDYPSELWTQAQCLARYPNLRTEYCRAGLFFPGELSANPRRMIHRLLAFLQQGPRFSYFPHTLIREIDSAGSACTARDLSGNTYRGEKALLCSGTEFAWLYPERFQQSDLEWVKLQMLRLKPQQNIQIPGNILTGHTIRRYESFQDCPSFAGVKAREDKDSFWKKWSIHILFKQEADGSIILGDSHEYGLLSTHELPDYFLREEVSRFFIEEGQKIMSLEHWEVEEQWLGLYAQCRTQDIFLDTVDGKVHIATGIGGKGMTGSAGFAFDNLQKIYGNA